MNKELLVQLVENTFSKLSTPAPGTGLYTELKNVVTQAFELGRQLAGNNEEGDASISPFSTEPPAENLIHHTAIYR